MIRLSKSSLNNKEKIAINRVIGNSYLGMGPEVKFFEEEIADYLNTSKKVIAVSSGTAALHLALQACGAGKGTEVLVPSITYVASFQVISATGAKPIACDIDGDNGFIDLEDAKKRINKKTKVIMPVHYASNAQEMKNVYRFAKKHQLRVVEDAAHSFGSFNGNKRVGQIGDVVCFSFDGIKNITSGEGGAILTSDKSLISKLNDIRLLGVKGDSYKRYSKSRSWNFDVQEQGWRYHLSDVLAAIGRTQLRKVKSFQEKRKRIVNFYISKLTSMEEIELLKIDFEKNHQHIFPIKVLDNKRDLLKKFLEKKGIQTGIHYQPNHLLSKFRTPYKLTESEKFGQEILSIPLHPDLNNKEIKRVVIEIKNFFLANAKNFCGNELS